MKELKCSSCGATLVIDENKEYATCNFCGSKYKLNEDLNININLDDSIKDVVNETLGTFNHTSRFMFVPIVIFVIIFIAIVLFGILNTRRDIVKDNNQQQIEERINKQKDDILKDVFNYQFSNANGTKSAFFLTSIFDDIIQSNKIYDRKVILVFNGKEMTDENEIIDVKHTLDGNYEVSVDYDEDGYIYRIRVDKI